MHPFTQYVNPHLGKLLTDIKMDKQYVRGDGCYLYDEQGKEYLDCMAAYGAIPFGYCPTEIWEAINQVQLNQEPTFIQPSALNAAGELAKRLIEIAPDGLKYVTFANSGAESVEVAIKLCRSATGRLGILSTKNSFHGKTMAALSATGNPTYQQAFGAPLAGFSHIPYGDLEALAEELEANPEKYAALLVEPIQGEGGIVVPPVGYLKRAKELCQQYGVIFVLDEIQSGLGRSGALFACLDEDVTPDVMLLAKALGGGVIPIGACLCTKEVYNQDFADKHSSTFAAGSLACRVGLKVLDLLTRNQEALVREIRIKGELFKVKLEELKIRYPRLIKSIRGRGLMLGIEFSVDRDTFPGSLLGVIAEQEYLTPIISSYLLNIEKLRVAPTLNGNHVIRIEPPLTITQEQILDCVERLDHMLQVLNEGHTAKFLSYLIDLNEEKKYQKIVHKKESTATPTGDDREGRFAFLIHPVDLKNYCEFDESLYAFDENELQQLTNRWNDMVEPFVVSGTRIRSAAGHEAYGEFIAIPRTADELIHLPKEQVLDELKAAIQLARERGAQLVGLGAFTSVVSMGGLYLKDEGMPLTTGNSYTVVSAVDAVVNALNRLNTTPEEATVAIVGATGSIGKGTAMLISESVSQLILIGNPENHDSSMKRLHKITGEIYQYLAQLMAAGATFPRFTVGYKLSKMNLPAPDAPIKKFVEFAKELDPKIAPIVATTSIPEMVPQADVIISATNSIDKLIAPDHLKYGSIVCDMSRPGNVSREVDQERPDVLVIDGGVIQVPGLPSLGWNFGFEKGLAYACMAETMMLALEQHYTHTSIGSSGVSLESILFTRELANKHGFELADLRSFDRPLSEDKWQQILESRMKKIG